MKSPLGGILFVLIHSPFLQIKALVHHDTTNNNNNKKNQLEIGRRDWAKVAIATSSSGALLWPNEALAAGLATKLASKDPAALSNSVFNVPPTVQVYPEFMRGIWNVQIQFAGFLFPSTKISKARITQNVLIPGFQKCSIATICDVGKDASYQMTIDPITGVEDRIATLSSQIHGFLGYDAVQEILYNPKSNPNRISIDFVDYQTKNAERIELFVNARDSEMIPETGVFVCSEYIRQVTFGTGSEVGIPRQVVGNYAHFWTWRPGVGGDSKDSSSSTTTTNNNNINTLKGNLLTAAYLDPQDPMFFEEPSKPVAVYSHILTATRNVAAI